MEFLVRKVLEYEIEVSVLFKLKFKLKSILNLRRFQNIINFKLVLYTYY